MIGIIDERLNERMINNFSAVAEFMAPYADEFSLETKKGVNQPLDEFENYPFNGLADSVLKIKKRKSGDSISYEIFFRFDSVSRNWLKEQGVCYYRVPRLFHPLGDYSLQFPTFYSKGKCVLSLDDGYFNSGLEPKTLHELERFLNETYTLETFIEEFERDLNALSDGEIITKYSDELYDKSFFLNCQAERYGTKALYDFYSRERVNRLSLEILINKHRLSCDRELLGDMFLWLEGPPDKCAGWRTFREYLLTLDKAVLLNITAAVIQNCLKNHDREFLSAAVLIYNCASLIFEGNLEYDTLTDNAVLTVLRKLNGYELKENYFLDADAESKAEVAEIFEHNRKKSSVIKL